VQKAVLSLEAIDARDANKLSACLISAV